VVHVLDEGVEWRMLAVAISSTGSLKVSDCTTSRKRECFSRNFRKEIVVLADFMNESSTHLAHELA